MSRLRILITISLMITSTITATIVDKRYYLQGGNLTVHTIKLPGNATVTQHIAVGASLSGFQILDSMLRYKIMGSFLGSGNLEKHPVDYFTRAPGTLNFQKTTEDSLYIKIVSSKDTAVSGLQCDYWFKFLKTPADTINTAIMHRRDSLDRFHTWFGYAILIDSAGDPNTGKWTASGGQTRYYPAWMPDSSTLDNLMRSGWTTNTSYNGTTKKGTITIQLFKAIYDTIVPPTIGTRPWSTASIVNRTKPVTLRIGSQTIRTTLPINTPLPSTMTICDMKGATVASVMRSNDEYVLSVPKTSITRGCYILRSNQKSAGSFILK